MWLTLLRPRSFLNPRGPKWEWLNGGITLAVLPQPSLRVVRNRGEHLVKSLLCNTANWIAPELRVIRSFNSQSVASAGMNSRELNRPALARTDGARM